MSSDGGDATWSPSSEDADDVEGKVPFFVNDDRLVVLLMFDVELWMFDVEL